MPVEHWMKFGTFASQRHFIYPTKNTYDCVLINANMAAHAPSGLAGFLIEKTFDIKYIIDPLTYAFQFEPSAVLNDKGEVKSSIQNMAEAYEEPIVSKVGNQPIVPEDFSDPKVIYSFVDKCLNFQNSILADAMAKSDSMKYLKAEKIILSPYALVVPYFYMTETTINEWLDINVKAVQYALDKHPEEKIFTSIVVSQGIVSDFEEVDKIIKSFNNLNISGLLIWVDDLYELSGGKRELKGLIKLAQGLRKDGEREVINVHGGYFSVLAGGVLGNNAFSGVTHGPEFGEHRAVLPVGGGIPIARYYIPRLHARIRYPDATYIFKAKGWLDSASVFHEKVCDCDECKSTLNGDAGNFTMFGKGEPKEVRRGKGIVRIEYPTKETTLHCLQHYLQRKKREYDFASNASKSEALNDLRQGVTEYINVVGGDGVGHLELWGDVFQSS